MTAYERLLRQGRKPCAQVSQVQNPIDEIARQKRLFMPVLLLLFGVSRRYL